MLRIFNAVDCACDRLLYSFSGQNTPESPAALPENALFLIAVIGLLLAVVMGLNRDPWALAVGAAAFLLLALGLLCRWSR